MDTAFINRVGITSGWAFAEYSFYPPKTKSWLLRMSPFSFTQGGRDRNRGRQRVPAGDRHAHQFARNGNIRFDRFDGFETWAGQRFDRGRWRMFGGVQLYRWLNVDGQYFVRRRGVLRRGRAVPGPEPDGRLGVTLQPSGRLSQALNYRRVMFDRKSTGERVYDLDIVYSRTTYQFSRQFFIRAIVQYDSSRSRVLTDFLVVVRASPGHGRLRGLRLAHRTARSSRTASGFRARAIYETSQRGLFFKAS